MRWVSPSIAILVLLWGSEIYGWLVMRQVDAKLEGYKRVEKHHKHFVRALCRLYADFAGLYSGTAASGLISTAYVIVGHSPYWRGAVIIPIIVIAGLVLWYTRRIGESYDMNDYVDAVAVKGPRHVVRWLRLAVAVHAFVIAAALHFDLG